MTAVMAYCCLVALLLSVAAWIVEHALTAQRQPRRFVWLLALLASLAVPATMTWATGKAALQVSHPQAAPIIQPPASRQREAVRAIKVLLVENTAGTPLARGLHWANSQRLDRWLQRGWVATSILLLSLLAIAGCKLSAQVQALPRVHVEGIPVRIAHALGPAVFGPLRPQIVLPCWLLEAPRATRGIVLAHERAHVRALDPLLYSLGLLVVALVPWNLPLWWQLRRLRFAIEVDCDRRVLRTGVAVHEYGETLLAVGQYQCTAPLGAMTLTESVSQLEQRIEIMTGSWADPTTGLWIACASGSVAIGAMAILLEPPGRLVVGAAQTVSSLFAAAELAPAARLAATVFTTSRPAPPAAAAPSNATVDGGTTPRAALAGIVAPNIPPVLEAPPFAFLEQSDPPAAGAPEVQIQAWAVLGNRVFKRRLESLGGRAFQAVLDLDVPAQLREAERNGEIVILSQPTLVTRDRQRGELSQQTHVSFEEFSEDDVLVERLKKVAFNLLATPEVRADGTVQLNLRVGMEVLDSVVRTLTGELAPGVDLRSSATQVSIPQGKTLLFAGMFRTEGLFKSNPKIGDKDELMFFVSPVVLANGAESEHTANRF